MAIEGPYLRVECSGCGAESSRCGEVYSVPCADWRIGIEDVITFCTALTAGLNSRSGLVGWYVDVRVLCPDCDTKLQND